MHILHGTWVPEKANGLLPWGKFVVWAETLPKQGNPSKSGKHPFSLGKTALQTFLETTLGMNFAFRRAENNFRPVYFLLPTAGGRPLPSYDLCQYTGTEMPESFEFRNWEIACLALPAQELFQQLKTFQFLELGGGFRLGADLLFWLHFTESFKQVLFKDQYIPALHPIDKHKFHYGWEMFPESYTALAEPFYPSMPLLCRAGFSEPPKNIEFYTKENLLRHFSEHLLHQTVASSNLPNLVLKKFEHNFIYNALTEYYPTDVSKNTHQNWLAWKAKLFSHQNGAAFTLAFRLEEARAETDDWSLHFLLQSKKDPSLKLTLADFWSFNKTQLKRIAASFGEQIEKQILLGLGYAARMMPRLWDALETTQPTHLLFNLNDAFNFLKEDAWVLEDSGFKVMVPAWWTPKGRRKAKIRLKTSAKNGTSSAVSKGFLSMDSLVNYHYELSINGEPLSDSEWRDLVNAKSPLVQFRGEWMELDQKKMQEMLEFWQTHKNEKTELDLIDFLKMNADEEYEFEHDTELSDMLEKLRDPSKYELSDEPEQFRGSLREYQKRGLSWLCYLEQIGLNGCLADDMGLGKTIQVIARLLDERENGTQAKPTLLIAPTSVLGNWQKEIERFAPSLNVYVHHGTLRIVEKEKFGAAYTYNDVIISSYTLARKDEKLLKEFEWKRVVLDEAQNIKNPKAAQTKSILKLEATHRLALTGTPVENRLQDLWSIFNFLNPGYLGKQAEFRKGFELPVQRDNDPSKARMLKTLVEPFILRRLKTDTTIIKDLPDKVEQKVYCKLSTEQASLYEAVVNDVETQLKSAEGIGRKGLILSTLMKLKQICNHPRQFLGDESAFSDDRSLKLSRLAEMMEEAIENNESILIFSQFREICEALRAFIIERFHIPTHLLHGGTSAKKRQQMIEEFQNPENDAAVFILSLKAGGVGITLTKANHVFHFDRWWNPAVENQATDRAFRIGQTQNVFVHKFVTIGTLEERIDEMIEDKKKIADSVVGSDESWLTELDNDAFKQLIKLNKEAIN